MRIETSKYHAATNLNYTVCGKSIVRDTGHLPWDDPEDFVKPSKLKKCKICIGLTRNVITKKEGN